MEVRRRLVLFNASTGHCQSLYLSYYHLFHLHMRQQRRQACFPYLSMFVGVCVCMSVPARLALASAGQRACTNSRASPPHADNKAYRQCAAISLEQIELRVSGFGLGVCFTFLEQIELHAMRPDGHIHVPADAAPRV